VGDFHAAYSTQAKAAKEWDNRSDATMQCPRCSLENIPEADTCDCGYDFRTATIHGPPATDRQSVGERKNADPIRSWIVLSLSVFLSIGLISQVGTSAISAWSWLTICYGTASIYSIWLRARTRSVVAAAAIAVSVPLFLYNFMQWASFFK
jgi:hypothetical protein